MTNQEAIKWIKYHIGISNYDETDELLKAFELAIKALELEPRYDCVSRQAVEDAIANTTINGEGLGYGLAWDIPYDLPPVTPQQKIGRWAILKDEYGDIVDAVCSCCDEHGNHKWIFCPNCGAKMEVRE